MHHCSLVFWCILLLLPPQIGGNLGTCSQEKLKLSECAKPHKEYIGTLNNLAFNEYLDKSLVSKFVEFAKTVSACIGPATCDSSRHYRFFLDALSFIGETYVDVESSCIHGLEMILKECFDECKADYIKIRKNAEVRSKCLGCVVEKIAGNGKSCASKRIPITNSTMALWNLRHHYKTWKDGSMKPMVFKAESIK